MELVQVKNRGGVIGLMGDAVIFPAESGGEGQGRGHFPFVLEIGHVESAAEFMAAPGSGELDLREGRRNQAVVVPAESQIVTRSFALVQAHAANFDTGLE